MKIHDLLSGNSLSIFRLFWRFTQEAIMTAAIYIVLVAVTLILGYFAGLEQEPQHKYILEKLEFFMLLASSLVVFLVILSLTGRAAIDLYRDFSRSFRSNEPASSSPVEASLGERREAPLEAGTLKPSNRLALIVSSVVLLGMLGAWGGHKRQIEDLRKSEFQQKILIDRLRNTAKENYATLCSDVGGSFEPSSLTCHIKNEQGEKVVTLRLTDMKSSKDK